MRLILLLYILSSFVTVSHAQTIVVEDSNLSFSTELNGFGDYEGLVCQAFSCDPTSVWFDYSAGNLEATTWNIDEESDWYVLELGEEFSAASIASNQHPIIFTTDNPRGPVALGGPDIYLGVSTGVGFSTDPVNFVPNRDVFGWVHLQDNSGILEFVSSAVVYGGEGIIAGTTTTVPEPGSGVSILLLTFLASLARARRI